MPPGDAAGADPRLADNLSTLATLDCTPAQGDRARRSPCFLSASIPSPLAECLRVENDPAAIRPESSGRRCRASLDRGRARKLAADRMRSRSGMCSADCQEWESGYRPCRRCPAAVRRPPKLVDDVPLAEPRRRELSTHSKAKSGPTGTLPETATSRVLCLSLCCRNGRLQQAQGSAPGHLQSARHEIQALRRDCRHSQRCGCHRQVRRVFLRPDGGLLKRAGCEWREESAQLVQVKGA